MAFRKKKQDPFQEIQACLQRRDYKGALDWFNTLLQKDPRNTQIRLRFADTLVLAGSKKEAVKQLRVVADELAEKGFMIRAIAINKKILQIDPTQTDVHQKLASMNEERSTETSSRAALQQLLHKPTDPLKRSSDAPAPKAAPAAPAPAPTPPLKAAPAPIPEISLEESMAMEFGEVEAPPEIEIVEEEARALPEEPPVFAEEPIALTEGNEPEKEAEELEVVVEAEEEPEVIELEAETEAPPVAAQSTSDEVESLIGALGEDIDSLIDSIIDDIGSASGAAPAREPAPTHIPLFSDLTAQEFIAVALLLVRRVAKVGEVIVREGDPGDSMFIVSTGEVRATLLQEGRQVPVATMHDGDFFGEMAVLSGEPRTATVTAVKTTELLELSREHLSEICARHPDVEAKIRLAYDERVSRSAAQKR
jgi:tetratricopeptide (TPR) repeat protein